MSLARWLLVTALGFGVLGCDDAATGEAPCDAVSCASQPDSQSASHDAAAAPAEDSGRASDAADGGRGDSGDTGEPAPEPAGTSCNQDGGDYRDGDGSCVECVQDSECPGVDCTLGSCVPNCNDGIQNGTEMHVDCGGTTSGMICPACPAACTDNWECDGISAGGAGAGICYDGACVDDVHGCTVENSTDFTGMVAASQSAPITIDFGGGLGNSYTPRCIKVTMGTKVRFAGSFSGHALIGGIADGTEQPAATGPFTTVTDSGTSADFVMDDCAAYPYYCDDDGLSGMTGAVIVLLP